LANIITRSHLLRPSACPRDLDGLVGGLPSGHIP